MNQHEACAQFQCFQTTPSKVEVFLQVSPQMSMICPKFVNRRRGCSIARSYHPHELQSTFPVIQLHRTTNGSSLQKTAIPKVTASTGFLGSSVQIDDHHSLRSHITSQKSPLSQSKRNDPVRLRSIQSGPPRQVTGPARAQRSCRRPKSARRRQDRHGKSKKEVLWAKGGRKSAIAGLF